MPGGLIRVSGPASEPVSLASFKTHLRITSSTEDSLLEAILRAARESCEDATGRCLIAQTWDYKIDAFDSEIRLPRAPLLSVTHIKYLDDSGVEQTVGTSIYRVDAVTELPRITLEYGQVWPTVRAVAKPITIRFIAGYDDGGSPQMGVPESFKQAIKILGAHFYENREAVNVGNIVTPMPMTVDWLIGRFKLWNWTL